MAIESRSAWWMNPSAYVDRDLVDLVVGLCYVAVAASVLLITAAPPIVRAAIGLPLLVFLPGYAVLAALFPVKFERHATGMRSGSLRSIRSGSIDLAERIGISFGLSVALLPLFGLALTALGFELTLVPIVWSLVLVTAAGLLAGIVRRMRLPAEQRFQLPVHRWHESLKTSVTGARPAVDVTLNVALAVTIVLAAGVMGYGLLSTSVAETDSTMVLLTEAEDGSLTAEGYPANLSVGESTPLTAAVQNDEDEPVEYTLVVQLQRVDVSGNAVEVRESQEVARMQETVGDDETWHASHTLTPELTGEDLRLTYLLYTDSPPAVPTIDSAYRHSYVWMNVTGAA